MSPTDVWRTARWRVVLVSRRSALRLAPFYRAQLRRVVFIGVTGSCGKSTTKELIATVLSSQLKGHKNPGTKNMPHTIASTILRVKPNDEFCVLEIAAAKRGERIPLERPLDLVKPRIGVVTNIGTDHISAFGSVEAIAAEKGKLIAALPPHGIAILNADDPNVLAMRSRCAGRVITYGLAPDAMVRAENVSAAWPERLSFTVCFNGQSHPVHTQLPGAHLVHCALAAVAVGLAMGLPLTVAVQAISTVPPFPRRMSPVIRDDGVTFIQDDAKAPLWSIPAVLDFMKAARAGRKIVVIGTISDYTGNSDRAYVSVARQALAAADQVVFVGSRASKSLKARRHPQDDALQAFPSVRGCLRATARIFPPGRSCSSERHRSRPPGRAHLAPRHGRGARRRAARGAIHPGGCRTGQSGRPATGTHLITSARQRSIFLPAPSGQSGSGRNRRCSPGSNCRAGSSI